MIKFGVIGYGYWGPNIVRNLTSNSETTVKIVCDANPEALKKVQAVYPHIEVTSDYKAMVQSNDIDAVAIITPVSTHYDFAKQALECEKHVFVEKPFTATSAQATELIDLAAKKKLQIMVDYTFIFTGAVKRIKEEIDKGTLGDLYYYDSTRVSLGFFQQDVNVVWDLAPHDFSIIDYVIKNKPVAVTAHGMAHVTGGLENVAYITVYFENNLIAHLNVNWLSPVKIRSTFIGGQKKMLVWDDLKTDEKIRIYDKGVNVESKEGIYRLLVDYRSGDMWSPRVDPAEALRNELSYFAECLNAKRTPVNDGQAGLRVVRLLELSNQSLKNEGKLIRL